MGTPKVINIVTTPTRKSDLIPFKFDISINDEYEEPRNTAPDDTECWCTDTEECKWTGIIADTVAGTYQENWESPMHPAQLCPECDEPIEI